MATPAFWLPPGSLPPRARTASAAKVDPKKTEHLKRLEMPWQKRALQYYDLVPELKYAAQFYSRMLKRVKIYPALQNEDAESWERITEGEPLELLNRIQDPGGGRSAILGAYGRLMFITGDGYLLGTQLETGEERWSFVWRDEVKLDDRGNVTHVIAPNVSVGKYEVLPSKYYQPVRSGTAVVYRMWTPHPRYSGWPDSPMQSVLDIAEELIVLTKSVHATATSRLARNGLLFMPEEIAPPPAEPVGDEDPENDPYMKDLAEHVSAQIQNPSEAEAMVPLITWVAGEYIAQVRHIQTHDAATDYVERDLRKEAVTRMALGLDFPPEFLLGMAQANHWTSWQISDQMWSLHGAPIAEQFCDDLNEAYLRPALEEIDYPDADRVVVVYDDAQVVVNPDRTKDADAAWDRGAIGYKAYLKYKGFEDDDMQTPEEHAEWLMLKTKRPAQPLPIDEVTSSNGSRPEEPVPEGGPENVREREGRAASSAVEELGAAKMALMRCREKAGAKIRDYHDTCPDCLAPADGKQNALVAAAVGEKNLGKLRTMGKNLGDGGALDPRVLVKGGASTFKLLLADWGYAKEHAEALGEMIETHAARTIFEVRTPELPAGFVANLERMHEVRDAMRASSL